MRTTFDASYYEVGELRSMARAIAKDNKKKLAGFRIKITNEHACLIVDCKDKLGWVEQTSSIL